jgi:uncharacterized phage infection (PIP) family protein YhgE
MTVLRKIAAVVVMVLAALGLLLCIVGLIGVWAVNEPITGIVTGAFGAMENYLGLAGNATQATSEFVGDVQRDVDRVTEAASGLKDTARAVISTTLSRAIGDELPAKVARIRKTASAVADSAVQFNNTLESLNRLPGLTVPTLTDELQSVGQRIETIQAGVNDIKAAVDEALPDGSRITALTVKVSSQLQEVQTTLNRGQARIESTAESVAVAKAKAPGWIDLGSVAASLGFILFGAGQLFLFIAALDWFKRPAGAAT